MDARKGFARIGPCPGADLMPFAMEGIVLYSEDLDRARTFYRDVLGLPLLLDEGHVIHFDAGTIRLAIHRCPPGDRREAPVGFLLFGVDNLSEVHTVLTRWGFELLCPAVYRPNRSGVYLHVQV